MAHFETDAEVYDQLGGILTNLVGNTSRLEQLRQADGVVQFAFRAPDAKVTLDLRAGRDVRVELGDSRMRPDVVLSMDADTGYSLLHGELSPTVAFARGAVRLKGPVGKALRVVPATVNAHEVEADQPVEPVVAGAEPETPAEGEAAVAEAPVGEGARPAAEGEAAVAEAPVGEGARPAAEGEAAAAEAPVGEGAGPAAKGEAAAVEGEAAAAEGEAAAAEAPVGEGAGPAAEGEAAAAEVPATQADTAAGEPEGPAGGTGGDGSADSAAEAADAAGGEEPPAASEDQA